MWFQKGYPSAAALYKDINPKMLIIILRSNLIWADYLEQMEQEG